MVATMETSKLVVKSGWDLTISVENIPPMSGSSSIHLRTREDEWFHVLRGEVTFQVGHERVVAGPGTSVFAWRGTAHTLQNCTAETATVVRVVTPDDLEKLFSSREQHIIYLEINSSALGAVRISVGPDRARDASDIFAEQGPSCYRFEGASCSCGPT